jgi:hypothetical protein
MVEEVPSMVKKGEEEPKKDEVKKTPKKNKKKTKCQWNHFPNLVQVISDVLST